MVRHLPGHRLFFPIACLFAAVSLSAWTANLVGLWVPLTPFRGPLWFVHETIFGFVPGMLAGYLTLMTSGPWVVLAFLLWAFARVAAHVPAFMPIEAMGAIDAAFLPVLVLVCARTIGRGWRFIPVGVTLFAIAMALLDLWAYMIAAGELPGLIFQPLYAGAMLTVAVLATIGGRLLGTYLRIYLHRPMPHDRGVEVLSVALAAIAVAAWLGHLELVAGIALIAQGFIQLVRLLGWWDRRISNEPLLSSITAGFFWLAAALMLWGAGHMTTAIPAAAGLHLLVIASLGPIATGMALRLTRNPRMPQVVASRLPVFAFWLLTVSALLRLAWDMAILELAGRAIPILSLSAAAWSAAYLILAISLATASFWLLRLTTGRNAAAS